MTSVTGEWKLLEILWKFEKGRPVFFHDLRGDLLVVGAGNLKAAVDIEKLPRGSDLPLGPETADKGLQDPERHATEGCSGLIAMNSLVEVHLGEGFHSPVVVDVKQVGGFYSISHGERNLFEDFPANSILA